MHEHVTRIDETAGRGAVATDREQFAAVAAVASIHPQYVAIEDRHRVFADVGRGRRRRGCGETGLF